MYIVSLVLVRCVCYITDRCCVYATCISGVVLYVSRSNKLGSKLHDNQTLFILRKINCQCPIYKAPAGGEIQEHAVEIWLVMGKTKRRER